MASPEKAKGTNSKIWSDPRFSHLVSDPRFKRLPKAEKKVRIDKRFESMFHDDKFKVKYSVDKYGRKINKSSSEDLKKFYDLSSSDEDDVEEERKKEEKQLLKGESTAAPKADLNDALSEDGEVLSTGIRDKLLDSELDYARGEGRILSDSSSDEESSDDEEEVFIEHVWGELDNEAERTDESSRRLAACNMDWDRIRAVDIMVLCNSFLPAGGSILSVRIYPSDFGKQRLLEEETHGPPELAKNNSESEEELVKDEDSDVEEGDDYHMEKLRQYQLNRLKYYYAVIECDSVATADKLYKECDGLEYESTATKLDLRFIPDDVDFEGDQPREVCTELPGLSTYKPRIFTTTALYQAKVDLTWDETNIERKELSEKLTSGRIEEVNDAELRNYVAYSSEDDGSEDNHEEVTKTISVESEKSRKISTYKTLLESLQKKEEEEKNKKFEMEFTWGINVDVGSKNKTKGASKDLTPIEKILEKRREKNKLRKEERKRKRKNVESDEGSSDGLPDGIDMNDPYFAEEFANGDFERPKTSKSKGKKSKDDAQKANSDQEETKVKELELLLDDDDNDKQHFSLAKIQKLETETKSKKKRRKKLKKTKQEIEASKANYDDNFEVNVNDERFKALYTSHLFNVDPTDPHFKKTKGMEKIIHEKLKRRHSKVENAEQNLSESPEKQRSKASLENRLLVNSLKRKIRMK